MRIISQLRFNPDTGEIYVYFWHNPTGQDIKRLMLMNGNNQNKKEDESSSSVRNELSDNVMKKGGTGNRNRPEIITLSNKFKN